MDERTARRRAGGWMKSRRWQEMRAVQLSRSPFCQCPHHEGRPNPPQAEVVDHRVPHRGDSKLFFDAGNLQSMAKECHDIYKQSQEKGGTGFLAGCDEQGWPLDRSHPFFEVRG